VDGDVVQVQGKWALVEWYPAMRREKVEAHTKPKPKAKARKSASIGGKVGSSKVTSEQVQEIKARAASGVSQYQIAKEFNLSRSGVQHILRGDTAASRNMPNLRVVESAKETA